MWSDGSPQAYSDWLDGEPNDWGGGEDCTGINFGDIAKWDDYTCGSVFLPFVCEL